MLGVLVNIYFSARLLASRLDQPETYVNGHLEEEGKVGRRNCELVEFKIVEPVNERLTLGIAVDFRELMYSVGGSITVGDDNRTVVVVFFP